MNSARIIGDIEIIIITEFDMTSLIDNMEYEPEIFAIRKIPISKPVTEVSKGKIAL